MTGLPHAVSDGVEPLTASSWFPKFQPGMSFDAKFIASVVGILYVSEEEGDVAGVAVVASVTFVVSGAGVVAGVVATVV